MQDIQGPIIESDQRLQCLQSTPRQWPVLEGIPELLVQKHSMNQYFISSFFLTYSCPFFFKYALPYSIHHSIGCLMDQVNTMWMVSHTHLQVHFCMLTVKYNYTVPFVHMYAHILSCICTCAYTTCAWV